MENENKNIIIEVNHVEEIEVLEEVRPNRESKSKNIMYTAISVVLFFVLYFGVRIASDYINRDYLISIEPSTLSNEQLEYIDEYTGIITDENAKLSYIYYEKTQYGKIIMISYTDIEDLETFTENNITYEYGNIVEYDRYKCKTFYLTCGAEPEALGYVNIENPMIECVVFTDMAIAEYTSDNFTAEIMNIIKTGEKKYANEYGYYE